MNYKDFIEKYETKQDLKNLIKLHKEILDMNFNNKDLYILTDKLSTKVNNEISNYMKNNNISYSEYKEMVKDVDKKFTEDKNFRELGEDRLNQIFETCNTYETVDILNDFGFDKQFILDCFIDSNNILEASRNFSMINNEPFIYEDKEKDIYVTKDDLSYIYGEKDLENKTEEELQILGKSLAENYIEYSKNNYLLEFSEYVVDQEEKLEEIKETIKDFCINEYGEDSKVDFGNLSKVDLAYTTTEDGKHEIQVSADLVNNRLNTYLDGKEYESIKYPTLGDLEKEIENTTFDDLVRIDSDEETEEDEL